MRHTHHLEAPSLSVGYMALCDFAKKSKGRKSLNIPVETIRQMLESYEDMLDIMAFDLAKKRKEEYFPKELVDSLIEGNNPVRVYRKYRGLTQQELADSSGVSRDMIAMIETGRKNGSLATVKKLAVALKVDIEALYTPG